MNLSAKIAIVSVCSVAQCLIVEVPSHAASGNAIERATRESDRAVSSSTRDAIVSKMRRAKSVPVSIEIADDASPFAPDGMFRVEDFRFVGLRSLTMTDLEIVLRTYRGREIGPADLGALTHDIELEYMKRGLVCVVLIPAQEFTDGIVTIHVMESDQN